MKSKRQSFRLSGWLKAGWYALFTHHPALYAGRLLLAVLPADRIHRIENAFFTGEAGKGWLVKAVKMGLSEHYYARPETALRQLNRHRFWGGEAGQNWHVLMQRQYELGQDPLRPFRQQLLTRLVALSQQYPELDQLCEIGTGNGLFLQELSQQLPGISRFVGLDLNPARIKSNQQQFGENERLQFRAAEWPDFVAERGVDRTLFVACFTLEYFTGAELAELLQQLAAAPGRCALALLEPVRPDLSQQTASQPTRNLAYAHPYPQMVQAARFEIVARQQFPVAAAGAGLDLLLLTAVSQLPD